MVGVWWLWRLYGLLADCSILLDVDVLGLESPWLEGRQKLLVSRCSGVMGSIYLVLSDTGASDVAGSCILDTIVPSPESVCHFSNDIKRTQSDTVQEASVIVLEHVEEHAARG